MILSLCQRLIITQDEVQRCIKCRNALMHYSLIWHYFCRRFAVLISVIALSILSKIESNFKAILYGTIIFVRRDASNLWSVYKRQLRGHQFSCLHGHWRKKKFFRYVLLSKTVKQRKNQQQVRTYHACGDIISGYW